MAPPRNTLTAATGPRRFQIAPAVRRAVVLKIGISGPSGSGKTTSAVLLAYGLVSGAHPDWTPEECWAKIAVADTENRSAAYLVGRTFLSSALVDGKVVERHVTVGEFLHVPFEPPYDPETWIDLIRQVEMSGAEVLVLDSWTHEWAGQGGILEIKERLGSDWSHWAKVKPRHQSVKDAVRNSGLIVIGCARSKTDWAQEQYQDRAGATRTKPVKIGLKTDQDSTDDYEWGISFRIEHATHSASTDKDRTGLFVGQDAHVIGPATGQMLSAWATAGHGPGSSFWTASQIDRLRGALTPESLKEAFGESWRAAGGIEDAALKAATLAHLKTAYDEVKAVLVGGQSVAGTVVVAPGVALSVGGAE